MTYCPSITLILKIISVRCIPLKLEIKDTTESNTSACYLDLLLSIGRDGQLHTSLYDKRDDFYFHITNFPFLSSNIPSSPAYGVFISQLIRYARVSSSYECFILRAVRLSNKLLGQGCYTAFWMMTIYSDTLHWSGITPIFDPITDLDLIAEFGFLTNCEVSVEHLQWVRHANRGRLLLQTPGPIPLWDLQVF